MGMLDLVHTVCCYSSPPPSFYMEYMPFLITNNDDGIILGDPHSERDRQGQRKKKKKKEKYCPSPDVVLMSVAFSADIDFEFAVK